MKNRINVLLLEENQAFSMQLALLLQRMGFKSLRVRHPEAAKFVLDRGFSDLLIVGSQSGPEATHEIVREMSACVPETSFPILVVDKQQDPAELKACRAAGCQAFLSRPLRPKQLFRSLHDHLTGCSEKRRNLRCEVDLSAMVSMDGRTAKSHRVLSLSRGGALITATDMVTTGTGVTLVLPLESLQLPLAGTVLFYQRSHEPCGRRAFGISFDQLDAAKADQIDAYLEATLLRNPFLPSGVRRADNADYLVAD